MSPAFEWRGGASEPMQGLGIPALLLIFVGADSWAALVTYALGTWGLVPVSR
jgi:hypothetical protein